MKVHFIGIGGIGVSALARHFITRGDKVTGCDMSLGETARQISKEVEVLEGHDPDHIDSSYDLLVCSSAIEEDHPEIKEARRREVSVMTYPEALGELTKNFYTIAVSGTHGKSTTTSMLALVLIEAGLDPTVIVGTKLEEFKKDNYRSGGSKLLLIEADEYKGAFLNYYPDLVVLTNLEEEHLDFYRDFNHLKNTFQKYLDENLKEGGRVVMNKDDQGLKKLSFSDVDYFSKKEEQAEQIKAELKVPGAHNLENALAAYKTGEVLNVKKKNILKGLSKFKGAWRRFERKNIDINGENCEIILDYAHHPTELEATLNGLIEDQEGEVLAIFEPHQFQRTLHLRDKFIEVMRNTPVSKLVVTDIYSVAGREKDSTNEKVNSKRLVKETGRENVIYVERKKLKDFVFDRLQNFSKVAIIGAGRVHELEKELSNKVDRPNNQS